MLTDRDFDIIDNDKEYKYLRCMRMEEVEEENIAKLMDECDKKMLEMEILKNETPMSMWLKELAIVKEQYIQYKLNRQERQKGSGVKKVKVKNKKVKIKQLKN